jgi:hypothetical protein
VRDGSVCFGKRIVRRQRRGQFVVFGDSGCWFVAAEDRPGKSVGAYVAENGVIPGLYVAGGSEISFVE